MDAVSIIPALPDSSGLPDAFDYAALPAAVADRHRERAERIARGLETLKRRTVEAMGEIGRELLAAQAEMEHGTFLPWVEAATGLSKSSAYRFMDVARAFGPKLPTVGSLPPAVVQTLAAKTTPEPVRAAVLRRIEAGETIAPAAILDEVREAREEAKATAAAEREAARRAALSDEAREEEDALRARGEKGRAARERKEARERVAREEERRREKAEARRAAAEAHTSTVAFIDMVGADRLMAFYARHRSGIGDVRGVMDARRARATPAVKVQDNDIYRSVALFGFLSPEDRPRIEALAREIERDGLLEAPVVIRRGGSGSWQPWQIIDGEDTFRALHDVLGWREIPVHMVPVLDAAALDAAEPVPAEDHAAAAGAIVEASGGRTAVIVRSLRDAGCHGLADAVEAQTAAAASAWPAAFGGPVQGEQADRNRRGRSSAEAADLVRQADHVATVLPDLMLQAIEDEAWGPRSSASGKPLSGLTPAEWIASPEGLNSPPARVATMLEFALHAQNDPRPTDLAMDKASGREPDDRRRHAQRALEAFEALAGLAPRDD